MNFSLHSQYGVGEMGLGGEGCGGGLNGGCLQLAV